MASATEHAVFGGQMPTRRRFLRASLGLVGIGLLSGCGALPVWTRPAPHIPRIGLMLASGRATDSLREGFRNGLRDLGYSPGQDIIVEDRGQEGGVDQFPAFAAELVAMPVDILVVSGTPEMFAAKAATSTIPIVIASGSPDPV